MQEFFIIMYRSRNEYKAIWAGSTTREEIKKYVDALNAKLCGQGTEYFVVQRTEL